MRRLKREPNWSKTYPWAVNLAKIKRAHEAIMLNNEDRAEHGKAQLEGAEFDQAVLDHYTQHAGLVRGHENITIVGRRGAMKKNFAEGKSTTQVVGKDITEGEADESDENAEEEMSVNVPANPESDESGDDE